jgi:hypothetical protein
VHNSVPSILNARSEELLAEIKQKYELIAYNPLTIKEYIDFIKNTAKVT